jgi:hypothetical protein
MHEREREREREREVGGEGGTCKISWRDMSSRSFSLTRRLKMRLSLNLCSTITPSKAAPNAKSSINPYGLPLFPLPFPLWAPPAAMILSFSLDLSLSCVVKLQEEEEEKRKSSFPFLFLSKV